MNYQKYLHHLLELAVEKGASDLHISVGGPPVLRIVRKLIEIQGEKQISVQDSYNLALCLMTSEVKKKFFTEKSVDLAYNFEDKARFRINIFFQNGVVGIAFRVIPNKILSIDELNLPPILHNFTQAKQGFVLITGATSQGKSTTLAAMINEINHTRKEHIITIESPIEYVFKANKCIIDQREVGRDTLSFSNALRSALRQDPDVIMVGELRDLETMQTAITAAETGHLVLSTLHTNSASQTIHRLIDAFPSSQQNQIRAQLADSLLGVLSQRLLFDKQGEFIPVCEVMVANFAIKNLIRENKAHQIRSIIETSSKIGMISFQQQLNYLIKTKKIDKEIAEQYSLLPGK